MKLLEGEVVRVRRRGSEACSEEFWETTSILLMVERIMLANVARMTVMMAREMTPPVRVLYSG